MNDSRSDILYSLYIISKSGSLLYEKSFSSSLRQSDALSLDEHLFLSSTFHALSALSAGGVGPSLDDLMVNALNRPKSSSQLLSPTNKPTTSSATSSAGSTNTSLSLNTSNTAVSPPLGIQTIETNAFKLHCYQSLTGLKFVGIGSPSYTNLDAMLRNICLLYVDYALKNPFYIVGRPIRCELFDEKLAQLVASKQSVP